MSREAFELITLRHGARAVRHRPSGEVMHPSVGPWQEANLLYVDQGRLLERLAQASREPVRIWDVGLGAATNALAALTAAASESTRRRPLHVVSFERDLTPLRLARDDPENGFPYLAPWHEAVDAILKKGRWSGGDLAWDLRLGELPGTLDRDAGPAELVFFDPFSPETNPKLWTPGTLGRLREAAVHPERGTVLLTYSAATPTRVSLLMAGYYVGTGVAVGTKKETTVAATRPELLDDPLRERWLARWKRSTARAPHGSDVVPELTSHPQFSG
ncbi:MAG: MnmC family methyltransferase [Myxococcaceae bacterium]